MIRRMYKKPSKIFILILTLFVVTSFNFSFASKDNPSYKAGYYAGYEYGKENKGNNVDIDKLYQKFYISDDYDDLIKELGKDYDPDLIKDGFYDGFRDGIKGNINVDYAKVLGEFLGNIYGARDYQNGKDSNWEKSLPSDREIRRMFNLNLQDSDYRDEFIETFKDSFRDSYIKSYEQAMFEPAKITLEQGIEDGEKLGELLGKSAGIKDYYEGKEIDFTRNLPADRVIISEYFLNNDTEEYKKGFLSGFIRAYELAYNEGFREANFNDVLRDEEDAFDNGRAVGFKEGELKATNDFMVKLPNDWRRSIPDNKYIILEYGLTYQSPNYREEFISGFYDGYSEGYNSTYHSFAQQAGVNKRNSSSIPISGGSLNSLDNRFTVAIEPGTYYHDVLLCINTTYDVGNQNRSSLIKASDSYKVSILNTSGNLNEKKLIKLSFEYYGDRLKGGIYKLVNNRWLYIPSIIENGYIHAYVSPSSMDSSGSIYSVFVDKDLIVFSDIREHWAKDEINTYVRRYIIYGYNDMTFKPEKTISRAEFLTLLSRVFNWNLSMYTSSTTNFKDYNTFGNYNNIINYAVSSNYIKGYDDGTFKPNAPISYKEVEIIMNRVLGTNKFKWSDVAIKMLHDKKTRSSSFDNVNNRITRAEIAYMLYTTTESLK
jgi:hypothetical protein